MCQIQICRVISSSPQFQGSIKIVLEVVLLNISNKYAAEVESPLGDVDLEAF